MKTKIVLGLALLSLSSFAAPKGTFSLELKMKQTGHAEYDDYKFEKECILKENQMIQTRIHIATGAKTTKKTKLEIANIFELAVKAQEILNNEENEACEVEGSEYQIYEVSLKLNDTEKLIYKLDTYASTCEKSKAANARSFYTLLRTLCR